MLLFSSLDVICVRIGVGEKFFVVCFTIGREMLSLLHGLLLFSAGEGRRRFGHDRSYFVIFVEIELTQDGGRIGEIVGSIFVSRSFFEESIARPMFAHFRRQISLLSNQLNLTVRGRRIQTEVIARNQQLFITDSISLTCPRRSIDGRRRIIHHSIEQRTNSLQRIERIPADLSFLLRRRSRGKRRSKKMSGAVSGEERSNVEWQQRRDESNESHHDEL